MAPDATAQAPYQPAKRSALFQGHYALAQLTNLAPQLLDFLAQFGHSSDRIADPGGVAGIGCQERSLALVAHRQAVCLQLIDGGAGDRDGDLVRLLELRQRRELSGAGELAISDASPKVIGHLLIGELAGPLDHLHPKSRLGLCLIVPKRQR